MKTDVPLKRLTRLCPGDLLPLLGSAQTAVLDVETLELPASKTSLDTVLRLQGPVGPAYLHLVEWQGYHDQLLLWRTLGYLAWLGQNRAERPILATIVYLKPEDDTGDTLTQTVADQAGWAVRIPCVRLWEQDAAAAVASQAPGLITLAPLMGGATPALVEAAAQRLIRQTAPPAQGELLAVLGLFAEPLVEAERFIRLVTKERLMSSDLFSYLYRDKLAEFDQEKAALEASRAALEASRAVLEEKLAAQEGRLVTALQRTVEDVIIARFPTAPALLTRKVRDVTDVARLERLHRALLAAADLAEVERLLSGE